jgi:endoglucanase
MAGGTVSPPLRTSGGAIVDGAGRQVRLLAVNWYGAESEDFVVGGLQAQPLAAIVRQVPRLGCNAVRLPWSNELVERNPPVPEYAVRANPGLAGRPALEVFDEVVRALTAEGLMVVLDNHNSDAIWCCGDDGNDLWHNERYPESSWLADWEAMAARYRDDPLVVGADLRNEPRLRATWGGPAETSWQAAAERGGNAVLAANPDLLVIVEGVAYAADLSGAATLPVELAVPDRVVYSAHDYVWFEPGVTSAEQWYERIHPRWGYLATGPDPRPLWVSEFGTCNTSPGCVHGASPEAPGFWFDILTTFLADHGVGWAYWPLNGTQSTGASRTWGAPETYGVLNAAWDGFADEALAARLRDLTGEQR